MCQGRREPTVEGIIHCQKRKLIQVAAGIHKKHTGRNQYFPAPTLSAYASVNLAVWKTFQGKQLVGNDNLIMIHHIDFETLHNDGNGRNWISKMMSSTQSSLTPFKFHSREATQNI
jgi:hypothetical protein